MIETVVQVALGGYLVFLVVVGFRLILLSRRTGGRTELLLGFAVLMGGVGYVPLSLALLGFFPESIASAIKLVGLAGINVSTLAYVLFTWHTFRSHEKWASALCWFLALLLVLSYVVKRVASGPDSLAFYLETGARLSVFTWASIESLFAYRSARRRLLLGLTDPMVVNRFFLWWMTMSAFVLMGVTPLLAPLWGDPGANTLGWISFEVGCGFFAILALWLAFFPPPRYRHYVAAQPSPADV